MRKEVHRRNSHRVRQTHCHGEQRRQPEPEKYRPDRNELEQARHTAQHNHLRRHDIKAAPQVIGVMDQPTGQIQGGCGGKKASTRLP
jgi:hypothetical protein